MAVIIVYLKFLVETFQTQWVYKILVAHEECSSLSIMGLMFERTI